MATTERGLQMLSLSLLLLLTPMLMPILGTLRIPWLRMGGLLQALWLLWLLRKEVC